MASPRSSTPQAHYRRTRAYDVARGIKKARTLDAPVGLAPVGLAPVGLAGRSRIGGYAPLRRSRLRISYSCTIALA
jgi:hypothetical protein